MTITTADQILAGLHERFQTLEGIKGIFKGEPSAIEVTPIIYTLFDEKHRAQNQALVGRNYRFMHRLVVQWVDNPTAEQTILQFVDRIELAIQADITLGGIAAQSAIVDQISGFAVINKVLYRVLDSFSETKAKAGFRDGI